MFQCFFPLHFKKFAYLFIQWVSSHAQLVVVPVFQFLVMSAAAAASTNAKEDVTKADVTKADVTKAGVSDNKKEPESKLYMPSGFSAVNCTDTYDLFLFGRTSRRSTVTGTIRTNSNYTSDQLGRRFH